MRTALLGVLLTTVAVCAKPAADASTASAPPMTASARSPFRASPIHRLSSTLRDVATAGAAMLSSRTGHVAMPPDSTPDAEAALWSGYSAASPHFTHARFAYTDFWYSYHPVATMPELARRYDDIMSGSGTRWRALNPTIRHTQYRLFWSVLQPSKTSKDYEQLLAWYSRHPRYQLEHAFLHRPGTTPDQAHRLTTVLWSSQRWLFNPADSGIRAYMLDDVRDVLASGDNGVFYDEFGRGTMARAFKSLELDSLAYQHAIASALAAERAALPKRATLIVNSASYTTPFDSAAIVAAGGVQLEMTDDPLNGTLTHFWEWIDHLVASGVRYIEYVSVRGWTDRLPATLTQGNEDSRIHRVRMGDYASYLIVRDTGRVVAWNQDNSWQEDPGTHWLKAYEANLGEPQARRSKLISGKDPLGQSYTVWQRPYTRALVLMRAVNGWDPQKYGDSTTITVHLPKPMRLLQSSGKLAAPADTVALRVGEGVILIP